MVISISDIEDAIQKVLRKTREVSAFFGGLGADDYIKLFDTLWEQVGWEPAWEMAREDLGPSGTVDELSTRAAEILTEVGFEWPPEMEKWE